MNDYQLLKKDSMEVVVINILKAAVSNKILFLVEMQYVLDPPLQSFRFQFPGKTLNFAVISVGLFKRSLGCL
jgi:hypothetical protein